MQCFGQGAPAASTAAPAASAAAPAASSGGGGGSIAFESQAIAYEALKELADEIAVVAKCSKQPKTPSGHECAVLGGRKVLLGTPANISAISAFLGFRGAALALAKAYSEPFPPATSVSPRREGLPGNLLTGTAFLAALPAITGTLTALKAQRTQTSGTFSANDQALYANLQRSFASSVIGGSKLTLVVSPSPTQIADIYSENVGPLLAAVYKARKGKLNEAATDKDWLKDMEAQLTSLEGVLTNAASASSILQGGALLKALNDGPITNDDKPIDKPYSVLTVTDDVAGGGTRANSYFFINIFLPAPHASYNGGAVVSYTFQDEKGDIEAADTLRFVFGYTKWKEPPLRRKKDKGYANYGWSSTELNDQRRNDKKMHGPGLFY